MSYQIKVSVQTPTIDRLAKYAPGLARRFAELATRAAARAAQDVAPVKTGMFRKGIVGRVFNVEGQVAFTAPHSHYVLFPTRPHMIYARRKQALYWPGADHPVKSVRHPGTKGNPATLHAVRAIGVREIALQALREIMGRG